MSELENSPDKLPEIERLTPLKEDGLSAFPDLSPDLSINQAEQREKSGIRTSKSRDSLRSNMESTSFIVSERILIQNFLNHYVELHAGPGIAEPENLASRLDAGVRLVKELSPQSRYMLGGEFIVTALIASAAIAKTRLEKNERQDDQGKIEDFAYGDPEAEPEKKVANIQEDDGGLSGSLTDYMFNHGSLPRPTFIIGSSDSLVSIAELLYQEGRLAYLVADLNKDKTFQYEKGGKRYVETRTRTILNLPLKEDLEAFRKSDWQNLRKENLITIVHDRSLDRELLEEELNPVVNVRKKLRTRSSYYVLKGGLDSKNPGWQNRLNTLNLYPSRWNSIVNSGIKIGRHLVF